MCYDGSIGKTKLYLLSRRCFFDTILTTMCPHRCTPSIGIARMKPVSMEPVQSSQFESQNCTLLSSHFHEHLYVLYYCLLYHELVLMFSLSQCTFYSSGPIRCHRLQHCHKIHLCRRNQRYTSYWFFLFLFFFRNKGQMVTST